MAITKFEKVVAGVLNNKGLTGNIRFSVRGRRVTPGMFHVVAKAITDEKIHVRWAGEQSQIPGDGLYDHEDNTFYIRKTTADPSDLKVLIVHEAVHAYSDIVGKARNKLTEEIIAFIAGTAALYNMGGQIESGSVAYNMAMIGIGGRPTESVDAVLKKLEDSLRGVTNENGQHVYNFKDKYQFNGVDGVEPLKKKKKAKA